MFICEDVSFDIDGQKLFSNINLNLKPQKDLLITGPSGIGKTTLLSILCGIQKPTTGKITYNSIDLYNLPENKIDEFRGKNLGVVFQNFNLINTFTVKQNLEIAVSAIDTKKSIPFFNPFLKWNLCHKSKVILCSVPDVLKKKVCILAIFYH